MHLSTDMDKHMLISGPLNKLIWQTLALGVSKHHKYFSLISYITAGNIKFFINKL